MQRRGIRVVQGQPKFRCSDLSVPANDSAFAAQSTRPDNLADREEDLLGQLFLTDSLIGAKINVIPFVQLQNLVALQLPAPIGFRQLRMQPISVAQRLCEGGQPMPGRRSPKTPRQLKNLNKTCNVRRGGSRWWMGSSLYK